MIHKFEEEFFKICSEIIAENKSPQEWREIESDDMFQYKMYEGGFDGDDMKFCFAVYIEDQEYWFQISLETVQKIHDNTITEIEVKQAKKY